MIDKTNTYLGKTDRLEITGATNICWQSKDAKHTTHLTDETHIIMTLSVYTENLAKAKLTTLKEIAVAMPEELRMAAYWQVWKEYEDAKAAKAKEDEKKGKMADSELSEV